MKYAFNAEIAAEYGIAEAVFIENLYYWIRRNRAAQKGFADGRTWTYSSMRSMSEHLPFFSVGQIRRIVKKLAAAGAICVGNYNASGANRTYWYALGDGIAEILKKDAAPLCAQDEQDAAYANGESGASIKYNIKYNNKNNGGDAPAPPKLDEIAAFASENGLDVDAEAFFDYYTANGWMIGRVRMRDWRACLKNWMRRQRRFDGFSGIKTAEREQSHIPFVDYAGGEL